MSPKSCSNLIGLYHLHIIGVSGDTGFEGLYVYDNSLRLRIDTNCSAQDYDLFPVENAARNEG